MKKRIVSLTAIILTLVIFLSACAGKQTETDTQTTGTVNGKSGDYSPYATENRYDIDSEMFEKQSGVDYGTLLQDVSYYSTIAGDNKQINILLPPGYDEKQSYPVTYIFHGFGSDHNTHLAKDSYIILLYGNMLHQGLTVPQILVGMDMYTDKLADKKEKTDEQMRFIYDKAIKETGVDLMPFIEANYPVKTGRENTAIAGMSEGGAKSLCTGFEWLDKFGYIGSFAPDTGVIPTEFYKGTFWNTPYMEQFPQPNENNVPYYLYLAVGSEDPWNIDCTLYYRDVLTKTGFQNQTDYVEEYGHDSAFWGQCFYNFFSKIFHNNGK
ncbi:MAG: hypothetical protein IKE65_02930 [Clostridia bacterium]|nr:hypothetical protein [Clostridia bacterium]